MGTERYAAVHVDTIKCKEHLSPNSPPDEDHNAMVKTIIARAQIMDFYAGRLIACAMCKSLAYSIISLYRCRYCGVWYCIKCADLHFKTNPPTNTMSTNTKQLWIQYAEAEPANSSVLQTADSEEEAKSDDEIHPGCPWYRYDIIPGEADGKLVNPDGPIYFPQS